MIACLAAFAIVGVALVAAGGRPGPRVFLVGAVPMALSFAWVVSQLDGVLSGGSPEQSYIWIGQLGLTLDLRLDGFGATMSLIVTGIGVLVMVYAHRYFGATTPDMGRLAGLLVLFSGAMVGLVQADHLLLVYVCWEITSITSYLLIGHNHTDPGARAAALHALLVTGAGGLAMLGGFVVLGQAAGTYRISEILAGPRPTGTAVTVALALILVGAFTKSAQYPFHSWLPGAMAAPTPVSAYLHSATMVKAGVYLIARLAPMFAATVIWQPAVIVIGLLTMIAGGLRALRQNDLKLLLAFGTVSQLGFMVVLFGLGTPEADLAGWLLLVSHALFKAALFMVVGVIDHDTGTRDIRELPVFGARWRWLEVATALSLASMAGVPFLSGFIAKEAAYGALEVGIEGSRWLVLAGLVAGSMLTVAYGYRFYRGAFLDARRCAAAGAGRSEIEAPAFGFGWPVALLAAVSLAVGVLPAFLDDIASVAVGSLIGADEAVHLSLWHGLNLPLALSAVTLVGGVVLCVADRRVQPLLATGRGIPTGEAAYLVLLRGMTATARRVTGVVQNGSLPVYAGIILLTVAVTPAVPLLADWDWPGWPELTRTAEVPVAAMLLLSALGAAVVRRRFSAAIFLGAAGYSMAALFVVYGAPDLALTQAAIETLATVVFVLVLRRLPERFERRSSTRRRVVRMLIASTVGVVVFVFALMAAGVGTVPPVSDEMIVRSLPDGHGRNVVNVILVDFRGLDTMAEISVLAVASIGAVALARAGRRPADAPLDESKVLSEAVDAMATDPTTGSGTRGELRRVVFVDVSAQLIFPAVIMASLWLLFAGHNQPGGGFVGGLLAGSAITLRYIAGGIEEVRRLSRFRPWTVLGSGLLLATATAAAPLLGGGEILEVAYWSFNLPVLADTSLSSALLFDLGVYVTVVGMVLMAFESFGDAPPVPRPPPGPDVDAVLASAVPEVTA